MHASIKDIEAALPETLVSELLAIADDATFDLIHLFEAAVQHDRAQDLAADAAGAVGDDWLVLEVVILATLNFVDEVMGCFNVWNHCVFEFADLGFEGVSAIEEDDFVALFFDKGVYLSWLQVLATVLNSGFLNLDLVWLREGNKLFFNLDRELGKFVSGAIGPLEVGLAKARVVLGLAAVLLEVFHVTTQGAIDAMLGDEDSALEIQRLAKGLLPQHHCLRVFDRGE